MSIIQNVEDLLLSELTAAIPELSVESFPAKPSEYNLLHPYGAILIQYDGSSFGTNRINGAVAQPRTLRFTVVSMLRNFKDKAGCYDILERISSAVTGLRRPGLINGAQQLNERFFNENDGIWFYIQSFDFKAATVVPNKTR